MKIPIIIFTLSMMFIVFWNGYQLKILQKKVSNLFTIVEREACLSRHNIGIINQNKELNDKNMHIINENFKKLGIRMEP